ncbi:MAG TPA: DUF456 domain-containing protein [Patescibacteria group bacterium]|jgi:hypothetical protein|nr:DUF456 domain-containing protein [Patescibacteria group bacterium]
MNHFLLATITFLFLLVGLAGVVLPFLPGVPLAFVGLLIYAWATHFEQISVTAIIVFALITAATFVLDIVGPALGAKSQQASKYGVWGAVLGGFLGVIVMGPLGIIAGTLLGAFTGEMLVSNDSDSALRKAWGAFVGLLIASLIKVIVVVGMMIYFIFILFR